MSDEFDDLAIESHAKNLVATAREDANFAAAILLAASRMLAATGNRAEISRSIRIFKDEVWTAASGTPDAISEADAFLARIRRAEGEPNA